MSRAAIAFEHFGEDRDEAGEARARREETPPPPPEETELYRQGFEAGLEQARQIAEVVEREAEAARARLATALSAAEARRAEEAERLAEQAAALVRKVVATLTPALAARGFAAEAAALVRERAARAAGGAAVARVSPSQAEALRRELLAAPEPARSVSVIEDRAQGANAMRVEWEDGLAEIDLDRAAAQVLAALGVAAPQPQEQEQPQEPSPQSAQAREHDPETNEPDAGPQDASQIKQEDSDVER